MSALRHHQAMHRRRALKEKQERQRKEEEEGMMMEVLDLREEFKQFADDTFDVSGGINGQDGGTHQWNEEEDFTFF